MKQTFPRNYWTKEKCKEVANLCETRKEFKIKYGGAYKACHKNRWMDEVCFNMKEFRVPKGFWTKEKCIEEALKYDNRTEYFNCSKSAAIAFKNGWIEEILSHIPRLINKNGYWTKDKCCEEALKYETRKEFAKCSKHVYCVSYENGWLDDVCSHMRKIGNLKKRCIYSVEFDDNVVYIGLTHDINERFNKHLIDKKSSVYKHIEKTKLVPIINKLTDYIEINEASKMEEIKKEEYKNNGWIILNKAKCGGVGGSNLIWAKEKCLEVAKQSKTKTKFRQTKAYKPAQKNKWLEDIYKSIGLKKINRSNVRVA
jgi:predicted GIY-YIG superfamily endonuclease